MSTTASARYRSTTALTAPWEQLYHPSHMGQRRLPLPTSVVFALSLWIGAVMLLSGAACDQSPKPATAIESASGRESGRAMPPSRNRKTPTLASLSPAATDLLVGMGAGDHLIAVSNFDAERDETRGLDRVGDYRTQDWEKLSALRPQKMIIQMRPDRLPPGLRDR